MKKLTVALNGLIVGSLVKDPDGAMLFTYHANWLEQAGARAISLSLPLQALPFRGNVVYNFFDNLLPDNEQIRNRIQARFRIATKQPFDLLSSIGMHAKGIPAQKAKMAMAMIGKNRHFHWQLVVGFLGSRICLSASKHRSPWVCIKIKLI